MNIDLNTLYLAITITAICSVLNTEPVECATYNVGYLPHHHAPHSYLKGYGLPSHNALHHPYHYPGSYQYPHPHQYHPMQQPAFHHDPHIYQQHEDNLLRESAKDPRNLKNGILHNGGITYDLGMPRYEILNAHEEPEIITSDQPHYQEHLKQLQQHQNFTLEDFGATTAATSTTEETTTTEQATEPQTTTPQPPDTDSMSSKESKYHQRSVSKEQSSVKDKIQKFNDHVKTKSEQNSKSHKSQNADNDFNVLVVRRKENLSRKMKPAPFKAPMQQAQSDDNSNDVKVSETESESPTESDVPSPAATSNAQPSHDDIEEPTNVGEEQPMSDNMNDFFVSSQNTLVQASYGENQPINAIPAAFTSLPAQYSVYHPYQALQRPLNTDPGSEPNVQRMYRSVSFLATDKKTEEAR